MPSLLFAYSVSINFITSDQSGRRFNITRVDYQFIDDSHTITLSSHGNSKCKEIPYMRTQRSTLDALKNHVKTKPPRITIDLVQEDLGGIRSCSSNGKLPRNINQVYNCKKTVNTSNTEAPSTDPYNALIMKCKEESKDENTAFIRKISIAPEPIVICCNEKQLNDMVKFCTEDTFSILQIDPTYDLGNFYVTVTQYEHLLLRSKRTGVHPAMVGPVMIHQKKKQETYIRI